MHKSKISELEELLELNKLDKFKYKINNDPFILSTPYDGLTVFQFVCMQGPVFLLQTLLNQLTDQQIQMLGETQKPEHWRPAALEQLMLSASKAGNDLLLSVCLQLGADVNTSDKLGNRPLHYVMTGREEAAVKRMALILLKYNVDEHLKNKTGQSAVDLADPTDRTLADWFIQSSRSIRLQELRVVQKKVQEIESSMQRIHNTLQQITSRNQPTYATKNSLAVESIPVILSREPLKAKL